MPSLWTKMDYSAAKARIPSSAIHNYLSFSKGVTTDLSVNQFVAQQEKSLLHIVRLCRGLKNFRIHSGSPNQSLIKAVSMTRNLRSLMVHCDTTPDCVSQVLGRCPTLTRLEFHRISTPISTRRFSWPSNIPKLRALTLHLDISSPHLGWPISVGFALPSIVGSVFSKLLLLFDQY